MLLSDTLKLNFGSCSGIFQNFFAGPPSHFIFKNIKNNCYGCSQLFCAVSVIFLNLWRFREELQKKNAALETIFFHFFVFFCHFRSFQIFIGLEHLLPFYALQRKKL